MRALIHTSIGHLANLYNRIESYWHGDKNHRILGGFIVLVFIVSLLLIYLNKLGLINEYIGSYIPDKYFSAIVIAFWILLLFEIFSLIFVLPKSVSSSMLTQFEIFSLILLRDIFKSIESFPEPIEWNHLAQNFYPMALDAFGALMVFIGIYFIRKMQLHRSITTKDQQNQFIEIKKVLSLLLIGIFIGLAAYDAYLFLIQSTHFQMFNLFYTVMIFFDVAIVLISLRYNLSYVVLFRYSGFTLATIMLRFSLSAPPFYKALIGVISVIFVIILTFFYSKLVKQTPDNEIIH